MLNYSFFNTMNKLLGQLPVRSDLKSTPKLSTNRNVNIRVERSFPFEWIGNILSPFFEVWDSSVIVSYSEYDTTLANIVMDKTADIYVLWLDWRLYRDSMDADKAVLWVEDRLKALRIVTSRPILINNWPEKMDLEEILFSPQTGSRGWFRELNAHLSSMADRTAGCGLIDLAGLAIRMSDSFFDERNDLLSHYPFSDQASIAIARHLGVQLAPAVSMPRLKAIALDLDDTLYSGVLSEDGIDGIIFTAGHYELHKLLLRLKKSGVLLTLCSRNELKDAAALFHNRSDFPLQWEDFTAVCVNWQPKSDNLQSLAAKLNIDPSAFLFIDDNPAELLKVAGALPEVRLLQASSRAETTAASLSLFPGLYMLRADDSALVRSADIKANQIRENLQSNAKDYVSYLSSLQMIVRITVNCQAHAKRIYELSHKTNQFNLALSRLSEVEVETALSQQEYLTVTVQLSDFLVDSGIVGLFICEAKGDTARLSEVLFSCRALGREIETVAFVYVLELLIQRGISSLLISVQEGPRNAPARDWLKRFVQHPEEQQSVSDLLARVKASCVNHPAKVEALV